MASISAKCTSICAAADGPRARLDNFAARAATDKFLNDHPEAAAGTVRAIVKTHEALRADPSIAKQVALKSFPEDEAQLIVPLIARDAPFYDAATTGEAVDGLNRFAVESRHIDAPASYDELVATQLISGISEHRRDHA